MDKDFTEGAIQHVLKSFNEQETSSTQFFCSRFRKFRSEKSGLQVSLDGKDALWH